MSCFNNYFNVICIASDNKHMEYTEKQYFPSDTNESVRFAKDIGIFWSFIKRY